MGSVEKTEGYDEYDLDLDNDEDLVKQIDCDLKEAEIHSSEWRNNSSTCYDMYAGEQWDEEDLQKLEDENRQPITFNRIARTINAVSGLELQNRQEVRFLPRTQEDGHVAEIQTATAKWVRDNCDAEDEESEMFQDVLICGMGWTETLVSYETNLNGSIEIDRIDPNEMYWDPHAKKRNLDDRRWNARKRKIPVREFKALWPDAEIQLSKSGGDDNKIVPHNNVVGDQYKNQDGLQKTINKGVDVVQYQYVEKECVYRIVDPFTGDIKEVPEREFKVAKSFFDNSGMTYIKQYKKTYKQAFKHGNQILERGPCPVDGFTFNCITGFRNRNTNSWHGLVKLMIDPQMWANKWLTQILHIINSNAKGGLMFESGAFRNPRQAMEDWGKPNAAIELTTGALAQGKIQQLNAPQYPDGLDRMTQMAMQNINDIPGVNLELLGVANRDQAGYLEMQRREAGVTILATFFDSLRRYRKEQGRVLADFIRKYISDGRMIRIVGQEGAKYVPLVKDSLVFEYDIVVDDAPTSPNQKEKVFSIITQLLPTLLQASIPIPPEILDYAPIPEGLRENWKAMLSDTSKQQKAQQLEALNMQIMQLDAAKKEKEVGEIESKTILNIAKAQEAKAVGADEAAQAANKLGLAQSEQANKNRINELEMERKEREFVIEQKRKDLELALEHERLMQREKMAAHKSMNLIGDQV